MAADPQTRPMPHEARRHGAYLAACLATLLYVALSQHVLPSGDLSGWRAGPFAGLLAALPEAWSTGRGAAGLGAANRLLEQRMDAFERQLEDGSHLRRTALPTMQWLLSAIGGVGNETAYVGRDGWLILRSGFDYLTGPPFLDPATLKRRRQGAPAWQEVPHPDPRPAILDLHHQLEGRGIRLLFLPVPSKPAVHPESLVPLPEDRVEATPHLQNPSFARLLDELETAGIAIFDPTTTLLANRLETGREQFLRTDSHWSPDGVDAVARDLADRIRGLELGFARPPTTWRRQPDSVSGIGDLERGLHLPGWQKLYAPQRVPLQRVVTPPGRPWQPDPRAEILILGDSFTNVFSDPTLGWGRSAGLAEQLSFYLQKALDRIAINAGGAATSRRRLAEEIAAGRDRLAGKRLVIWQLAVRTLSSGDWQLVELSQGS